MIEFIEFIKIYVKQVIAEAISTGAAYKAHIKSLFEQFINKFSASYLAYRKQNYPDAWAVKSLSRAEDFRHQHIKLLYKEAGYTDYALIFEHEGSIYVANDKVLALALGALALRRRAPPFTLDDIVYWHKNNYLFKLSVSDFETALDVADNYDELIVLCEQMNQEHEQE